MQSQPHLKKRSICRTCHSNDVVLFLSLGNLPPANGFLIPQERGRPEETFPLDLYFCRRCNLTQLLDVVDPELLFRNYPYFSSASKPLVEHFAGLAQELSTRYVQPGQFVVEIGSNDGSLLSMLRQKGVNVLGVEPAGALARFASEAGVETVQDFFSERLARNIRSKNGKADAVIATNVFAHIDDLDDVVKGVNHLLSDRGVFIVEAHYVDDLIHHGGYDQIYHEHLSYFSLKALRHLFERLRLEIFNAEFFDIHGKTLRVYVSHKGAFPISQKLEGLFEEERKKGLHEESTYLNFAQVVSHHREALRQLVEDLRKEGKRIVGYGAPAKGNILLNYCGLGPDLIDYLIDTTPAKQGTLAPGTRLAVHPPEKARKEPPDYFLLLAWNYADYILAKEKEFHRRGGRFIIPFPSPKIV